MSCIFSWCKSTPALSLPVNSSKTYSFSTQTPKAQELKKLTQEIVKRKKFFTSCQTLDFSNAQLSRGEKLKYIAEILPYFPNTETILLDKNEIRDVEKLETAINDLVFKKLSTLQDQFRDSQISLETPENLFKENSGSNKNAFEKLEEAYPCLKKIRLIKKDDTRYKEDLLSVLGKISLIKVSLKGNKLDQEGAEKLAKISQAEWHFQENPKVTLSLMDFPNVSRVQDRRGKYSEFYYDPFETKQEIELHRQRQESLNKTSGQ